MLPDGAVLKGIDACNPPDYNSFLKIPDEVGGKPVIGVASYAFSYALIKYIQLPGTIKFIGSNAFSDCYSIENIVLPDSIRSIGDYAFVFCMNLESVHLKIVAIFYSSNLFAS